MTTADSYTPQNPITEAPDWYAAYVKIKVEDSSAVTHKRIQVIDNRDPNCPVSMIGDPINLIAFKCFLVLIAFPFYSAGVMATHLVRCITLVSYNLYQKDFSESLLSLSQEIVAVVKVPFYGLAIEFSAILGLLLPLPMRSLIASLERDWSGSEKKDSFFRIKDQNEKDEKLKNYFINRHSKLTIFLAHCFQPLGKLNNPERVASYKVANPPSLDFKSLSLDEDSLEGDQVLA
jgi:hypothetical protein